MQFILSGWEKNSFYRRTIANKSRNNGRIGKSPLWNYSWNNPDKQDSSESFNHPVEGVGGQVWGTEAKHLHPQDLPITKEKPNLSIWRSRSRTSPVMGPSISDQCHACKVHKAPPTTLGLKPIVLPNPTSQLQIIPGTQAKVQQHHDIWQTQNSDIAQLAWSLQIINVIKKTKAN